MKADWRARLDAELRGEPGLQGQQGRLARRPLGRHQGRRATSTIRAAATPASRSRRCKDIGEKITAVPEGFHVHRTIQRFLDNRAQGDRDRRGHRLGDRRGAGLLLAAARRPSGAAVRPGQRARHLLAAPFGADRPGERGPLHPVQPSRRRAGALRGHQLDALGGGGARLRVRLFARRAECADPVGGAVRRLRQRRAGGVRPVHLVGRAQVAAHVRASSACCRTATRGRGRSIPRRGSSASCRCAPKTTCRSPTARRRRTTSTSCAGSSSARSASR